jgi:hypothetical protein
MGGDHDLRGLEVGQCVSDRQQGISVSDDAARADSALAQFSDRELNAITCLGDRVVDVREPMAHARVQRRGDDEHGGRCVACASCDLVD